MSRKRYPEELKIEAVKQVIERAMNRPLNFVLWQNQNT